MTGAFTWMHQTEPKPRSIVEHLSDSIDNLSAFIFGTEARCKFCLASTEGNRYVSICNKCLADFDEPDEDMAEDKEAWENYV